MKELIVLCLMLFYLFFLKRGSQFRPKLKFKPILVLFSRPLLITGRNSQVIIDLKVKYY